MQHRRQARQAHPHTPDVQILVSMKTAATNSTGRTKPHEPAKESADVPTRAPARRGPGRPRKQRAEGVQQEKQRPVRAQAHKAAPKRGRPRKGRGKTMPASPTYSSESAWELNDSEVLQYLYSVCVNVL